MIKKEVVEKVLETAQIDEVVGDFVELKKRGTSLIGNCPFHNEKTPSFHVSVSKGIYKCFGCGAGGDSLKFVMEHEKYSYPEAIRYLADKYSIEIQEVERSPEQVAAQDKRESLYILSKWAGKFFANVLWESEEGQSIGHSYFKERGYRDDIIKKFELGYSPDSWTALVDAASKDGFSREFLVELGLAIRRDDQSLYDRFRGRVIFPIFNLTGRTIGFGGRTLKKDKATPKYVNSPESDIYHKSDVLYGLNFARKSIVEKDVCYLVEGYADVLSMFQAGVENVVSSSGTSLTSGQIRLISRYTKNVVLLYDGDAAGIKATLRGTDMLLEEGLNVKVLLFPDGHDPDSYVRHVGSTSFKEFIAERPEDFVLFKTNLLLQDAKDDPIKRAEIIRDVVESIALIPDEIKVSVYIQRCSSLLNMEERVLLSELNKIRIQNAKHKEKKEQQTKSEQQGPPADFLAALLGDQSQSETPSGVKEKPDEKFSSEILQERELIRILLHYGDEKVTWDEEDPDMPIAPYLLTNLEDLTFEDDTCQKIISIYRKKMEDFEVPDIKIFISNQDPKISELAISCLAEKYELSKNWNDDKRKIYVPLEIENLKQLVTQIIYRLKKRKIESELLKIREELKQKDLSEDDQKILVSKYSKYKQMEMMLGTFLGNTIVK